MQPSLPIWFQGIPGEVRLRLELALAAAFEARLDTHAQQALNLVAVLASRAPFDQAVERYIQIMDIPYEDAQIIRTRALVALDQIGSAEELAKMPEPMRLEWSDATPLGAVRFVRRKLRRNAEEDLWMELSAARAEEALIRTHVKHSLAVVEILQDHFPPTRALSLYLDQLAVPSARARAVYQHALARVATAVLPRLAPRTDAEGESAGTGFPV
jgi:hypothetical protein